jgi:hypothetical protein
VADPAHPPPPPAPRKPRELRSLHSELGSYWGPSDQPRRSRSRQHISSDDLLAGDSSTFQGVKTFKRPAVAPINFAHSPQYPGGWPYSPEKLAEADLQFTMPPKQPEVHEDQAHHQPAATGGQAPADTTQQQPAWMAYLLDQMDVRIAKAIESEVIPRFEALEVARSRPGSPVRSSRAASPFVFAQPSQAPQSYVQPSQAPQSYVQPSQAPQPYVQPSQAPQSYVPQSQAPQSYVPQSQAPQSYVPPFQAPQSYVPQSVGPADFQQHRQYDDTHKKPRFRPESLPAVRYGDDISTWVTVMDHIILQHGEEIVCPEIFAHCFQSGDAIQLWYMDNDSLWKTVVTTKPGCWGRFKAFIEQRFSVDIGIRQIEAEDRVRHPHESHADFAIQKIFLIRRAFEHLAPSAIIAMVKRKLDWDAAQFCRERKDVNDFVSELMDFDNLRAMQATRQPQARGAQRGQAQPYVPQSTGSRSYKPQAPYQPVQSQQPAQYSQPAQYQPRPAAAPATDGTAFADPRLPTVQLRKHPQTGVDTLSYLDRFGKSVFIQRPCGHCTAVGKPNTWHFEFSCSNKPTAPKRARTYVMTELPGTFESPSGLPTSYTFSGQVIDPDPEENPFSIDDCDESGNGEGGQ